MGLPITKISNYKEGAFSLPLNSISLKGFIVDLPTYEFKYLCDLLGYDLFQLFLADLDVDNKPVSDRFVNIFNVVHVVFSCSNKKFISLGIEPMLQGFVCFEYLRSLEFQPTMVGTKKSSSENSEGANGYSSKGFRLYNQSVDYYQAIQVYIYENKEDYPEYQGVTKGHLSLI